MSPSKTLIDASTTTDSSTFQFVLQIIAELFPALQSIVNLIITKVPGFKIPGETIIGALQGFLEGEGALPATRYKMDVTTTGEYHLQLNNINAPTVTDASGNPVTVTPDPVTAMAADVGNNAFCDQWLMINVALTKFEAVTVQELPEDLAKEMNEAIVSFQAVGNQVAARVCR